MYAAICTRPNTSQAVGMVSKHNSKPTEAYLTAAKQILRYLKSTLNFALKYQKSENGLLIGYCDADWANDPDDRHFTTGHLFLSAGGVISWLSKKQAVVALSPAQKIPWYFSLWSLCNGRKYWCMVYHGTWYTTV